MATQSVTDGLPPPPIVYYNSSLPRWITAIVPASPPGPAFSVLKTSSELLVDRLGSEVSHISADAEALLFRLDLHRAILEAQ